MNFSNLGREITEFFFQLFLKHVRLFSGFCFADLTGLSIRVFHLLPSQLCMCGFVRGGGVSLSELSQLSITTILTNKHPKAKSIDGSTDRRIDGSNTENTHTHNLSTVKMCRYSRDSHEDSEVRYVSSDHGREEVLAAEGLQLEREEEGD